MSLHVGLLDQRANKVKCSQSNVLTCCSSEQQGE